MEVMPVSLLLKGHGGQRGEEMQGFPVGPRWPCSPPVLIPACLCNLWPCLLLVSKSGRRSPRCVAAQRQRSHRSCVTTEAAASTELSSFIDLSRCSSFVALLHQADVHGVLCAWRPTCMASNVHGVPCILQAPTCPTAPMLHTKLVPIWSSDSHVLDFHFPAPPTSR